ncbi:helix-hairpin-helix domain-containing protein [Litoribacter ruber]|uniref:ComEA family DNA-binding protein n=1 Tax=Litoribacter ruber TaxID=702568 RepID=UPI001BD93F22|nr:helix-hairpin-helix domain-containing protein [Litoribacter ruber]MBT0812597.1 helix-hairpin-helix domain-containing protein [Litoribacter ruber]
MRWCWAFFIFLAAFPILAQTYKPREIDLEQFAEDLFAFQDEELDYENLYEGLLQLLLNPVHLNKVSAEELQSLYILTPLQITEFINYRNTFGQFLTIYELQAIPEFDLETIYKLLPFVTLEDREHQFTGNLWSRMASDRENYLMIRHRRVWEPRKGYSPPDTLSNGRLTNRYLGDPNDLYVRFRMQHTKDFSVGFTLDKDPGEQFTWDTPTNRYGFNFLSYHFTLYNKGKWKTLALGDYQLQFGQGLVFGSGFSVGKGAEAITTVRRSSLGIRPYTSVLEFGYFRGAAFTRKEGRFEITALASSTPRDGNLQVGLDTLEREEAYISSLTLSGLHRTSNEIAQKAQLRENNIGGNIQYASLNRSFQMGINTLFTEYSQPFQRQERVYNEFEFRGKQNHIHSFYFNYNYQNYFFFGESARSKSGGMGTVLGLMSSLSPKVDLSLLYRNYAKNFHTFYGNGFGEGSRPINETGFYIGLQAKPIRKVTWSGYYDQFRFPWLRFQAYAPSEGYEWLQRITYSPSRQISMFVQTRQESKERNHRAAPAGPSGHILSSAKRFNSTTSLDMVLDRNWSIKSRVQFSSYRFEGQKTKGYTILQDLTFKSQKASFSGRVALFDTDDYDNRQYVYEKNVLWAFSIPAYYGQGIRYYLLSQYKISPKLTVWGRLARTSFTDRDKISSGLQEINGSTLTESTLQLRYAFNK